MIKALADRKLDSVELGTSLRIFKDRTLPFFQTISYPDISIVLDSGDTARYHLYVSIWPKRALCYQSVQIYDFRSRNPYSEGNS